MTQQGFEFANDEDGVEWLGGIASFPHSVDLAGVEVHPSVLLWVGPSGEVLGSVVDNPDHIEAHAAESLQRTIEAPQVGPPGAPARVRVSSETLAARLRDAFADLTVVCAPTPELDEVVAHMFRHVEALADFGDPANATYLTPGVDAELVAAFFSSCAALYRARPWAFEAQGIFRLAIESLGVEDAVVIVVGEADLPKGLLIFETPDEFEAFLHANEVQDEASDDDGLPPTIAVNFDTGGDLPGGLYEEVHAHGWEVAAEDAYPWLAASDLGGLPDVVQPDDVKVAIAAARVVAYTARHPDALLAAWSGGPPIAGVIEGVDGERVEWCALDAMGLFGGPIDPIAELEALEAANNLDSSERFDADVELVAMFEDSEAGQAHGPPRYALIFLDVAGTIFGRTVLTLDEAALREVLLDGFPKYVPVAPDEADGIVAELVAFYRFLDAEYDLDHAEAAQRCLPTLASDLASALADEARYDRAKAKMMRGLAAGYDVLTIEGADAWNAVLEEEERKKRTKRTRATKKKRKPRKKKKR